MQRGSIRMGRFGDVAASLTHLTGRPGAGIYRLELVLDLLPLSWPALHDSRVVIWADLEVAFANASRLVVGTLGPGATAFAEPGKTYPARLYLAIDLGPRQVEIIEEVRDGGEISLCLRTHGIIFPSVNHGAEQTGNPETFWHDLEFRLKPAEWIEILEAWHYAQGFLVQVPILPPSETAAATRAAKSLEHAATEMMHGRYRAAISACRDALETAYGGSDKDLYPELEYSVSGIREATKDQRFWLIRRGAWSVANAAKHNDDETRDIDWGRSDAQALILTLSALLQQDPPT